MMAIGETCVLTDHCVCVLYAPMKLFWEKVVSSHKDMKQYLALAKKIIVKCSRRFYKKLNLVLYKYANNNKKW